MVRPLENPERDKRIHKLRQRKLSWAEIGKLVGMDRNNARRAYLRVVKTVGDKLPIAKKRQ